MSEPIFIGKVFIKNGEKFVKLSKVTIFENTDKKTDSSPDYYGYIKDLDDGFEKQISLWRQ